MWPTLKRIFVYFWHLEIFRSNLTLVKFFWRSRTKQSSRDYILSFFILGKLNVILISFSHSFKLSVGTSPPTLTQPIRAIHFPFSVQLVEYENFLSNLRLLIDFNPPVISVFETLNPRIVTAIPSLYNFWPSLLYEIYLAKQSLQKSSFIKIWAVLSR